MSYLGIDLGNKRCGLAYAQMGIVFPLPYVPRVEIIPEIKKYIAQKNISHIVIGMPYDIHGVETTQLERTKKFITKLREIFPNITIEEVDERYSTFESISFLSEHKKNIFQQKDSMSACIILERYLASHAQKKELP